MSPCLFKSHVEYIIQNAGLDKVQARIKIGRRNNNNLQYADDTTLIAEIEKELKNLLMKIKEKSEKAGLKPKVKKKKGRSWQPISSLHGK